MNDDTLSAFTVAALFGAAVFAVGLFALIYADRMGWISPRDEAVIMVEAPYTPTPPMPN